MPQVSPQVSSSRPKRRRWPWLLGGVALVLVLFALVWDWNWLRPLVQAEASRALGRPVTIGHLGLRLGSPVTVVADDVVVGNPPGYPDAAPLARAQRLAVSVHPLAYLEHRQLVLPRIEVDKPEISAVRLPDGRDNWTFPSSGGASGGGSGPAPQIGDLRITDGHAHVVDPKLKADFETTIATEEATSPPPSQRTDPGAQAASGSHIVAHLRGTYAGQAVTGDLVGGALLSLRDTTQPWPIDIHLQNGQTKVAITGTVQDPLAFAGANVTFQASGANMADLTPLSGIPIPETPPYRLSSRIGYAKGKVRLDDIQGTVGHSDLEGTLAVADAAGQRPTVEADLRSRDVDLADLGGFIGTSPGHAASGRPTAEQKPPAEQKEAKKTLLPEQKLSLPRLSFADVHLRYAGEHIRGKFVPLDKLHGNLDIVNGAISVHPLGFAIGNGQILGNFQLTPVEAGLHLRGDIDFRQIPLSRLMAATHAFAGAGTIGGSAVLEGTGPSTAALVGNGNGELKLFMGEAGDISAVLVNLSGLEFGNALLSALGVPQKAKLECVVADLALVQGIAKTKALLVATDESNITGGGEINFRNQTIDYTLRTHTRHFSIGSLPAPIEVTGPLGDPTIRPGAELAVRGGAVAGLAVLFPPLALLPTIQLGIGQADACRKAMSEAQPDQKPAIHPHVAAEPGPHG